MLALSLWVIWPALLVFALDYWVYRRPDPRMMILVLCWLLLMLVSTWWSVQIH